MEAVTLLTYTVLAVFVGFEVVSKVTSKLHTPLMSGANAIHGIILVGAIIVAGQATEPLMLTVAIIAVVLATANVVGGFVVTDRMLEMFRAKKPVKTATPVESATAEVAK
ncbi:MAG: NAD(P) transhydrogenase subunit alpha [Terrimesophilobacter sp.]